MQPQAGSSKGGKCPTCGNADPFDRSPEEHKFFFAVVRMAFDNWPEQHNFVPRDAEHLRAWLLIEVGHYREQEFVRPAGVTNDGFRNFIRSWREFANAKDVRIFPTHNGVRMRIAKSIKKAGDERIGKKEFEAVARKVYELIEAITSINVDTWKEERSKWHAA